MSLGKQAAAYTLASSFPDGCGKVQDAPPNPFSVFFPSALSIGSAFMNTTPTFFLRWELLCFPFPAGLRGRTGPPLCKNTPVYNGRAGPRREKNLPRFPNCPAIAPGSLGKLLGFEFPCNLEYKTLLPPFLSGGNFCVSHSLRDWGEEQDHPSEKMRRCITGESPSPRKKSSALSRLSRHRSGRFGKALGAWFSHAIRNIKHCSHLFSLRRGRE